MSELETNIARTSKFTKNVLYLGGVIVSAFIGGALAVRFADPIIEASDKVKKLEQSVEELSEQLTSAIARLETAEFALSQMPEPNYVVDRDDLPNLDLYVLRSELPPAPNLTGYVKNGDRVKIETLNGYPLQLYGANSVIADSRKIIQDQGRTEWRIQVQP